MSKEPIIICNVILKAWVVCHRHYVERMKTFVLGLVFVYVLAHEQAISNCNFSDSKFQEYSLIMSERDTFHKDMEKLQDEVQESRKAKKVQEEDRRKFTCQIEMLKREVRNRGFLSVKKQPDVSISFEIQFAHPWYLHYLLTIKIGAKILIPFFQSTLTRRPKSEKILNTRIPYNNGK